MMIESNRQANETQYEYEFHFVSLQNRPAVHRVVSSSIDSAFDYIAEHYKEDKSYSDVCISLEEALKILPEGQNLCSYVQENDLVICGDTDLFLRNPCYIFAKELLPSKQEETDRDSEYSEIEADI